MIRGVDGQPIGANIRDASTGGAFTGAVTVYIKGDLTPQAQGTVGAGACASDGHGYFEYVPSAAETDFNHIAFTFDGAGAVGVTIQLETISPAQVSALQTATGLGSISVGDLVTEALMDLGVARAGDVLDPETMAFGVNKLNRLLDRWNADPKTHFNYGFAAYTLTPNLQPHTIGPNSADFTVAGRPAKIRAANIILTDVTPAVRVPVEIHDARWWADVSVQGIATPIPTDLYYSADWPNGSLYLWPVPTTAYQLEILTAGLFGVMQETDTFWLPFGYRDAVALTLSEQCGLGGLGVAASPELVASAKEARAIIFANNDEKPRMRTQDAGMPRRHSRSRTTFNYHSRSFRS